MPSPTPYLHVDLARLRRNVRHAADRSASTRVALRPHVKTHKNLEIARLQLSSGAVGITVATVGEAEVFARHGFQDIFIGYSLWMDPRTAGRLRDLTDLATVTIGVDSVEGAAQAGRLLGADRVRALVEVDCGQRRAGTPAGDAGRVAVAAARSGLDVRGVFTFPGHSYSPETVESAAHDEAEALSRARDSLVAAGLEVTVVSGGSTPTFRHSALDVVTELRPGVYVFGDAQQWELGVMGPAEIALACRASVVSHSGGRMVLDAGSKILGADRAPWATGYGRLPAHPDARVVLLAEHRSVVDLAGAPLPPLGSHVDLFPNHVCNAVNLVDQLWVEEGGTLRPWPVVARGVNC